MALCMCRISCTSRVPRQLTGLNQRTEGRPGTRSVRWSAASRSHTCTSRAPCPPHTHQSDAGCGRHVRHTGGDTHPQPPCASLSALLHRNATHARTGSTKGCWSRRCVADHFHLKGRMLGHAQMVVACPAMNALWSHLKLERGSKTSSRHMVFEQPHRHPVFGLHTLHTA